jgi:hypothetical protein
MPGAIAESQGVAHYALDMVAIFMTRLAANSNPLLDPVFLYPN